LKASASVTGGPDVDASAAVSTTPVNGPLGAGVAVDEFDDDAVGDFEEQPAIPIATTIARMAAKRRAPIEHPPSLCAASRAARRV
jgi:hypothetical protein